jgi:hypothetical protein
VCDPQQLLHPTADRSTSPATPAACRIFFIALSPVCCPAVANPAGSPPTGSGPHGRGACDGCIGFSGGGRQRKKRGRESRPFRQMSGTLTQAE